MIFGLRNFELYEHDCLDLMGQMPDSFVHAIVTDPPYGLEFMGKEWDHGVPGVLFWAEAIRLLKPGGHLLAFGGTRTYHRLACAIEDAGFEIRDCLMWLYGSGFPKSLDVSKAIDKLRDWSLVERLSGEIKRARAASGLTLVQIGALTQAATGGQYGAWYHRGGHMFFETGRSLPSRPEWDELRKLLPIEPEYIEVYAAAEREVVGQVRYSRDDAPRSEKYRQAPRGTLDVTAPATAAARQWSGWGTALKPAWEPIIVARKPLTGTVAANVQAHGTGALNVDGCRIAGEKAGGSGLPPLQYGGANHRPFHDNPVPREFDRSNGRWPANVVLDEEAAAMLDAQSGEQMHGAGHARTGSADERKRGCAASSYDIERAPSMMRRLGDSGGASRFFYTAKASSGERHYAGTNKHPTVKPVTLMRWLVRLVTPPHGLVLDPFMGSGSTGVAALSEGFRFIGIDKDPESVATARKRIAGPLFVEAEA